MVPLYEIDFCLKSKAHNKLDCSYVDKKVTHSDVNTLANKIVKTSVTGG